MKKRIAILSTLLLVVVACGGLIAWYFFLRTVRPDFDRLGGTILIYEVAAIQENEADDPQRAEKMAKALLARLDAEDRGLAVVQAIGKDRVEIRIPRTDDNHADDMARIKHLVSAAGQFELRILANFTDDGEAIAQATQMLNAVDDPDLKHELKALQEKGAPPPGLRDPKTKAPSLFTVNLPMGQKSIVTYRWVELGHLDRRILKLDNAAKLDPLRGQAVSWDLALGAVIYSRNCTNRNLSEEERRKKVVDYYVLARDPELDPNAAENLPLENRRTRAIDGSCLVSALAVSRDYTEDGRSDALSWMVSFSLNAEGTELFHTLTRKNVPTGPIRRYLAIILDGQVIRAASIDSEIPGGSEKIAGQFGELEARSLAAILRGATLPRGLKLMLMSEKDEPRNAAK